MPTVIKSSYNQRDGCGRFCLVPMQCEYFALEGLTALMDTISKLAAVVNEDLKIEGLLRTMYDPRNRLSNEVSDQLKNTSVIKSTEL